MALPLPSMPKMSLTISRPKISSTTTPPYNSHSTHSPPSKQLRRTGAWVQRCPKDTSRMMGTFHTSSPLERAASLGPSGSNFVMTDQWSYCRGDHEMKNHMLPTSTQPPPTCRVTRRATPLMVLLSHQQPCTRVLHVLRRHWQPRQVGVCH